MPGQTWSGLLALRHSPSVAAGYLVETSKATQHRCWLHQSAEVQHCLGFDCHKARQPCDSSKAEL